MNTIAKLLLISATLIVVGCNEKVSPELQSGNSSTTVSGPSAPPAAVTDFYFRVVDSSNPLLKYKVHKTGLGNKDAKCEVTSTTEFSAIDYQNNLSTRDISCFFEAEELALYFSGMKYKVEASANSCEYVAYAPFSYYDRQPGASTGTFSTTICAPTEKAFLEANGFTCATVEPKPEDYCRFNYKATASSPVKACDEGVITLVTETATALDADANGVFDGFSVGTATTTEFQCGGKASNCIAGPIEFTELIGETSGAMIGPSELDTAYTKEYELPGLIQSQQPGTRKYVNFRRDLASENIAYIDSSKPLTGFPYKAAFSTPFIYDFNPQVMNTYANNQKLDGTELLDSVAFAAQALAVFPNSTVLGSTGAITHTPFAAEPFLGFGLYKTNPFYTFYCLDGAYDVKARVRMLVRDWDRVLPNDEFLERISDVDLIPPFARQDVPDTLEVPGDPDGYNRYNDRGDWDDKMSMIKDDTDPSLPIWMPAAGYFQPANFPREQK